MPRGVSCGGEMAIRIAPTADLGDAPDAMPVHGEELRRDGIVDGRQSPHPAETVFDIGEHDRIAADGDHRHFGFVLFAVQMLLIGDAQIMQPLAPIIH